MAFLAVFDDFLPIFSGKRVRNFFGGPKIFSQKFDPKWFQIHLFELPNSFWPIMHYYLVMLKKSFFPIFPYNLGFHAKPPYRNALKKCVFPINTLGNIFFHKIESLGTLKINLEFYYGGGCMGSLSGS